MVTDNQATFPLEKHSLQYWTRHRIQDPADPGTKATFRHELSSLQAPLCMATPKEVGRARSAEKEGCGAALRLFFSTISLVRFKGCGRH
jgi:hypothetical protein